MIFLLHRNLRSFGVHHKRVMFILGTGKCFGLICKLEFLNIDLKRLSTFFLKKVGILKIFILQIQSLNFGLCGRILFVVNISTIPF